MGFIIVVSEIEDCPIFIIYKNFIDRETIDDTANVYIHFFLICIKCEFFLFHRCIKTSDILSQDLLINFLGVGWFVVVVNFFGLCIKIWDSTLDFVVNWCRENIKYWILFFYVTTNIHIVLCFCELWPIFHSLEFLYVVHISFEPFK